MSWWAKGKIFSIKYFGLKKEVAVISIKIRGNCDLFFCRIRKYRLILSRGCRSPPPFDLKTLNRMEERKWIKDLNEVGISIIHIFYIVKNQKKIYRVSFSNIHKLENIKISKKYLINQMNLKKKTQDKYRR